jgi:MATE family multidrug resistance protein
MHPIRLQGSTRRALAAALSAMLRLALPVITVQVGLMAMGVTDTVMVGRVSAQAIAAIALGNVYFFAAAIFGAGTLMALDPIVAQAVGANDGPAIARGVQRGLVLAAAMSLLCALLLLPARPLLTMLRQPTDVVPLAARYALVSIAGVVPFYGFVVLRQSLQAMHRMAPVVIPVIVANVANVGLNWVLVFGNLGAPALGPVGTAWATAICRWLLAAGLLTLGWRTLRPHLLPLRGEVLSPQPLVRMLRLGAPIGVQHQLEFGVFGVVGLLMGWFGTTQMAGHQVALNLASFTFMVPLGVSAAAAVLVGHAVGRGDQIGARHAAMAALLCGVGFMAASAVLMVSAPGVLARVYTSEPAVATVAATLIPLAGVFQVFDGTQVVSIGILRGMADTRTPMIVNVLGFWLIGLPLSAWLGFRTAAGPAGLWWGLVAGLAAVAVFLVLRVRSSLRRELRRYVVDHEPSAAMPG